MVNTPTDMKLYNRTKKKLYKKIPKHSAYRSGLLVQQYKKNFTEKYGKNVRINQNSSCMMDPLMLTVRYILVTQ